MELSWEKVKFQIKKSIPDHSYRMWIDPLALLEYDANGITLSTPNQFFIKRIKENYLDLFNKEFIKMGQPIHITLQANGEKGTNDPKKVKAKKNDSGKKPIENKFGSSYPALAVRPRLKKLEQATLPGLDATFNGGRMLKKGYTFDDFVVGDNSNFAYSASLSLAQGKMNGAPILYLLGDRKSVV